MSARQRRKRAIMKWSAVAAGAVLLVAFGRFALDTRRTDPPATRAVAERELTVNTLEPGEEVRHMVSVFQRPVIDYFRATRGVLVLTDRRLVYLGLRPRDPLSQPDMPPVFVERSFPLDTLVRVKRGRAFFLIARAIVISTPDGTLRLGVPTEAWPRGAPLLAAMNTQHEQLYAEGVRQAELRERFERERAEAEAARRRVQHYTVRRGDALASIASRWNTTAERLQEWNQLPNQRIRIGQTLVVRPET